jgi:hypothetical protein
LEEYVQRQVANLRAVGRASEAKNLTDSYLIELFEEWEKESDNPEYLGSLANAAITLENLEYGRELLESAISRANADLIPIDLTSVYWHLGRVHHYLRRATGDELWCYEMAIQAQAPNSYRYPANLLQKVRAYFFAYSEAAVKGKRKHEAWYKKRLCELKPDVRWDELDDVTRFLKTVSDFEKRETDRELSPKSSDK